jgi:hypothetical protein
MQQLVHRCSLLCNTVASGVHHLSTGSAASAAQASLATAARIPQQASLATAARILQQASLAPGALLPAKKVVQHYRQCSSAITQQTTGTACTAAALCKPTEHTGCHSLATATATLMILTLTTTRALHTGQCKHTGHTGCSTTMHSPARHSTGCCLPKHTNVQLC